MPSLRLPERISGCSSCSAYALSVTPALRVDLLRLPERLSGFADRPSLLAGRHSHPTLPVAGARIYNKVLGRRGTQTRQAPACRVGWMQGLVLCLVA